MNKNTVIAIVLSTLVVVASFIIQPILFPNAYNSNNANENSTENAIIDENSEIVKNSSFSLTDFSNEKIEEKTVIVNTNKAEIILTNVGGDIISYKLKEHIDTDTKDGVQMVDNTSNINRACAITFGNEQNPIINENFNLEKIDENTYLFTKKLSIKDSEGNISNFIFGKKYTFLPDEYMFKLEILIHGLDGSNSFGENGLTYTIRTSPQIGPHFNPKMNRYENRQFLAYNGNVKRSVISSGKFKAYEKEFLWTGIAGKYFVELVIPQSSEIMGTVYYSSLVETNNYANAQAILTRKHIKTEDVKDTYFMYYGPRNENDLKIYNVAEKNSWNLSDLKINESLQSANWLGWLETVLKWMMELIHKLIPNWGISIILLTLIIKLIMFPLTRNQSLSTLKMQEIQPKMQEIQKKYADNQQKMQEQMAKLYKEAGYNPMSGCLPMVFQFLILFAMYNLFNYYFEFRGASFIDGWISDLSSGDSIYTFNKTIPFVGNQLRILPIIYLASQLLFGKITRMGGTANATTQAQMNMMMYGMPVILFFLFYNAPSGLLLYWTVSNIFTMVQQIIINNTMKTKKAEIEANKNKSKRK